MNGVYVLANDSVYEHFVAFVKSFRKHNLTLPLTVIMFDERVSQIRTLSAQYSFNLWDPPQAGQMYEIGLKFYPENKVWPKIFKKICSFWGPYETFFFLDADIIVFEDLSPILEKFRTSDKDLLYFDAEPQWVYKDTAFREKMIRDFDTKHIGTGTFISRKEALTMQNITDALAGFDQYRNEFVDVIEQPFLNYCIDIYRFKKIRINELDNKFSFSCWYDLETREENHKIYWIYNNINMGIMVAMHWAGCGFSNIYLHHSSVQFLEARLAGEAAVNKYNYFLNFYHLRLRDILFNRQKLVQLFKLVF